MRMPSRFTSVLLSGAVAMTAAANGRARTPADSGLYPCTSWRYWVSANSEPNRARNVSPIAELAAENARCRKTRTSISGFATCSSRQTKAPTSSAPSASSPSVAALVQPRFGPSMTASTMASMAAAESTAPRMSRRVPAARRPGRSGTTRMTAAIATPTSGTFTQKTEPQ